MASSFVNGNNVKRADGVRNPLLVDDDNGLGMNSDETLVRHTNLLAARQFQRKRMKAILQPASDLLDNHGRNFPPQNLEATLQLQPHIRHRTERGARDGVAYLASTPLGLTGADKTHMIFLSQDEW